MPAAAVLATAIAARAIAARAIAATITATIADASTPVITTGCAAIHAATGLALRQDY